MCDHLFLTPEQVLLIFQLQTCSLTHHCI